jgi:hypothetical protein
VQAGSPEALNVIPDTQDVVPMSPEQAARHLRQATERVLQERRGHQQKSLKPPTGKVRDW